MDLAHLLTLDFSACQQCLLTASPKAADDNSVATVTDNGHIVADGGPYRPERTSFAKQPKRVFSSRSNADCSFASTILCTVRVGNGGILA